MKDLMIAIYIIAYVVMFLIFRLATSSLWGALVIILIVLGINILIALGYSRLNERLQDAICHVGGRIMAIFSVVATILLIIPSLIFIATLSGSSALIVLMVMVSGFLLFCMINALMD